MTTLSIALRGTSGTLATAAVTITDRDVAVDAQPASLTVSGLPAAKWRLRTTVSSTPAVGSGRSVTNTVDTASSAATTVTLPPGASYHCFKDFETGVGGDIWCTVELLIVVGSAETRYAIGTDHATFAAAPAARTDQLYLAQIHPPLTSAWAQPMSDLTAVLTGIADMGFDGIKTVAPWAWMETSRGGYDATYMGLLDTLFSTCTGLGLKVALVLGGYSAPAWAITTIVPPGLAVSLAIQGVTRSVVAFQDPDSWADYEAFVTAVCNRYTGQLCGIMTNNEPNGNSPQPFADVARWTKHTKAGVRASTVPTVPVVAPELSLADTAFLASLFGTADFPGNYDAISYHPYPIRVSAPAAFDVADARIPLADDQFTNSPGAVGTFLDAVRTHDPVARLWVSETGFATSSKQGTAFCIPESRQGDQITYVLRQLARARAVDCVTLWGPLNQGNAEAPGQFGFGFRADKLTRLPAYAAVKSAIAAIRAGTG